MFIVCESHNRIEKETTYLLKAGFLSVAKGLYIWNPKLLHLIKDIPETSLVRMDIVYDYEKWTGRSLKKVMKIIDQSPNLQWFELSWKIKNQKDAVWVWQMLLKVLHCNDKPKTIELGYGDITGKIDWKIIQDTVTSGVGSIKELVLKDDPIKEGYADITRHLVKNLEVHQLTAVDTDFAAQIQTKCFKLDLQRSNTVIEINWSALVNHEKMIIEFDIHEPSLELISIVEKVDHQNVHFIFVDSAYSHYWPFKDSDYYETLIELTDDLIKELPDSKVKTITYKEEEEDHFFHGVRFGPIIPATTFLCDGFLRQKFKNFINYAQTEWVRTVRFKLCIIFYFRQISKTGDKHENKFPKNLTLINGPIIRSNNEKTVAHS